MKLVVLISFLFVEFLYSCSGHSIKADKNQARDTSGSPKNAIITPSGVGEPSFPAWLKALYEKEIRDTVTYWNTKSLVIYFHQLTDSTSYCIYEIQDNVSSRKMLATQRNQKLYKEMAIGVESDIDYSWTYYSYTTYEFDSSNLHFTSIEHNIQAKPEYLKKDKTGIERFKDGYDLENVKTNEDSVVTRIKIDSSADIIVTKN